MIPASSTKCFDIYWWKGSYKNYWTWPKTHCCQLKVIELSGICTRLILSQVLYGSSLKIYFVKKKRFAYQRCSLCVTVLFACFNEGSQLSLIQLALQNQKSELNSVPLGTSQTDCLPDWRTNQFYHVPPPPHYCCWKHFSYNLSYKMSLFFMMLLVLWFVIS